MKRLLRWICTVTRGAAPSTAQASEPEREKPPENLQATAERQRAEDLRRAYSFLRGGGQAPLWLEFDFTPFVLADLDRRLAALEFLHTNEQSYTPTKPRE
jgi:hypothetical protein